MFDESIETASVIENCNYIDDESYSSSAGDNKSGNSDGSDGNSNSDVIDDISVSSSCSCDSEAKGNHRGGNNLGSGNRGRYSLDPREKRRRQ